MPKKMLQYSKRIGDDSMQISMMEAYIIETLKQKYSFEQLEEQLSKGNLSIFSEFNFDMSLIQQLHDSNPLGLKEAYTNTYSIKFLTINGLKNILRLRFGISEDNYNLQEFGVYDLKVNADTEKEIASILSSNWKIARNGEIINLFV